MRRYLFALLLIASPAVVQAGTITVSGQGAVSAVPDIASISMGVTHEAKDAIDAMDAVAEGINYMIGSLKMAEIMPTDMQTSQVSLNPVWTYSERTKSSKVTGFSATVTLRVTLRDLDTMGDVLTRVVSEGGNQFHGMTLGVEDSSAMEVEARQLAVADAMDTAHQLATAAGVKIIGVVSISEGGNASYPVARMADMAMASESMRIAAGETSVTQSVTMVFETE